MLDEVAIAVFTKNPTLFQKLQDSLKAIGISVSQFLYQERMESLQKFAEDGNLIAFFDTSEQRDTCLHWIQRLAEARPGTISVCLEEEFNQENSLQAIRAGAQDFLVGEFTSEEFQSLIQRLASTFEKRRLPSTVLGVLGASGGCGVSTLVANLAVEIAKLQSVPVGILGLNAYSSGPELLLNLRPTTTLFDLWERVDELDTSMIQQVAAKHDSGVYLITAQEWPLEYLPIPEKIVRRVIILMQELFPYVLLDLPREFSPAAQMALERTEALLLVTQYSMTAAAGAARILHALEMLSYPQRRIFWVANSVSEPAGLTFRQLSRVMSHTPLAKIPFDPETINWAAAQGICLSEANERAAVTKSIQKLAAAVCKSVAISDSESGSYRTGIGHALLSKIGFGGRGTSK